jgi:MFS superfamily sulfate permease-like transporter
MCSILLRSARSCIGIFSAILLAVVFGIVINTLAPIGGFFSKITDSEHMVRVPVLSDSGNLWESLNGLVGEFHFPHFKGIFDGRIWYYAFLIAVIASIESLLSLEAGDKIDPQKRGILGYTLPTRPQKN